MKSSQRQDSRMFLSSGDVEAFPRYAPYGVYHRILDSSTWLRVNPDHGREVEDELYEIKYHKKKRKNNQTLARLDGWIQCAEKLL